MKFISGPRDSSSAKVRLPLPGYEWGSLEVLNQWEQVIAGLPSSAKTERPATDDKHIICSLSCTEAEVEGALPELTVLT